MKIRYLGHSCFLLADGAGTRIVTDPFGDVGFSMPHVEAEGASISHAHFDHANVGAVKCGALFDRAGNYALGGIKVSAVESFHDDAQGKKRGKNLIFLFQTEGLTLCHLGDLGERCSPALLQKIGRVDVLLIPVGGNYTIGAAEAKEYIDALRPALVIPMHYKTEGLDIDVAPLDGFLKLVKGTEVEHAGCEIMINREKIDKKHTKIIVMERDRG